ncbi:MAG: methionine--tRNA ligase [Bacteroidetes bacterium]|nr:methionine--tRNA ligase [Bacteroidota bacterium]
MPKYTITAALPYANGPVHIGHVAGVYLPADIYARYMRNRGKDVLFICGSDEHGVPITIRARKEGITPQEVVDRFHDLIGRSFKDLGISFDIYSRTSSDTHRETAQEFFLDLYKKGAFQEEETEQYFDAEAGQFLADRYIVGTCPVCGNENAYGDQCEKCGSTLSPMELKNPRSALSGNAPVLKKTKNWYLPLDKLQEDFLNEYINNNTDWKSNVLGQCKSWLNDGLKPRAMTRDLDWGVKLPELPGVAKTDIDGKVLYVWFEAPIGYISATRELRPGDWQDWWKGDSELIHFIGKDNIVFHCIIFPAMLHLRGEGYVVPKQVPANEFLNLEGDKISTSRNWAVWLNEYLEDFKGKQDELRYVLGSILPETKDSEFTWKDYQTRVNSELVAILGNFVNRVMVLTHKYFEGKVPAPKTDGKFAALKNQYREEMNGCAQAMRQDLETFRFRDALGELINIARVGNKFLTESEPWKLFKENPEDTGDALNFALEVCANLAYATEPFLPFTHDKLCAQLNLIPLLITTRHFWRDKKEAAPLPAGHFLGQPELLFSKVEDDVIERQLEKLKGMKTPVTTANVVNANATENAGEKEVKSEIQYEDFAKMDIRVATILEAEKVEKADKLLKLILDAGGEKRTVVSGIAMHFKPEDIIGKQVLLLANLAPRKMRGIESQGMILMAEDADGKLVFVSPSVPVNPGSGVS